MKRFLIVLVILSCTIAAPLPAQQTNYDYTTTGAGGTENHHHECDDHVAHSSAASTCAMAPDPQREEQCSDTATNAVGREIWNVGAICGTGSCIIEKECIGESAPLPSVSCQGNRVSTVGGTQVRCDTGGNSFTLCSCLAGTCTSYQ